MRTERIENPKVIDRASIANLITNGYHVVLQFSKPGYTQAQLAAINDVCRDSGDKVEVRFYGHYGVAFDCSVVEFLPDVCWLSVDCLMEARNWDAIANLKNLTHLSFGVYHCEQKDFLGCLPLQQLRGLHLTETAKKNFDLSCLLQASELEELYLVGHTRNIDALGSLPNLRTLYLSQIPNKQSLQFVSGIRSLRRLMILLGGRTNISDVHVPLLEELEIRRVRGFETFDNLEHFVSLKSLLIEDQIRLQKLVFTPANTQLESLKLIDCKTLRQLDGLTHLGKLRHIRIHRTDLDINSIMQQGLPSSLKVFGFYPARDKDYSQSRKLLDSLGYTEFAN